MLKKSRIRSKPEEVIQKIEKRLDHLRALCAELFEREETITLEIGCGHGHFLTEYAKAHPKSKCIGIDLLTGRIERALRKKEKIQKKNLYFLKAEALEFLWVIPEKIQIETYFLLFPDPWPKRRHHKNRLLDFDFLSLAAKKSVVSCPFYFRTDHADYFEWGREAFVNHPDWELRAKVNWPFERASVFQEKADSYQSLVAIKVNPTKTKETPEQALSESP